MGEGLQACKKDMGTGLKGFYLLIKVPFTTAMAELPSPHSSVEDLMSLVTISGVSRILKA